MKALLIGGTGVISRSISELLIQKGWQVTLLNRGNRPLPEGAHSLVADIADEAAVLKGVEGQYFDVVADFIAFGPEQVARDLRLFEGRMGQYIFISSASAYQKPLARLPITESTPLANPYWQYSRDKIACEDLLVAAYRERGVPITIVRPSHTYDETKVPVAVHGGDSSAVIARMLAGKPILIHGDGSSLWTFTHAKDFAKGFTGLMANPHAIGEAVHITSDESITWNDAYRAIARALGVALNAVYVPSDVLAATAPAHGYDYEGNLLGDKANSVVFDNTKLKRLVPGFTAIIRFDEGVRWSIERLLQKGTPKADESFDAYCDKLAAAMAPLKDL